MTANRLPDMTSIVAWPDAIFVANLRSITHRWMGGGLKCGGAWEGSQKSYDR
jgi:hypothetical protein